MLWIRYSPTSSRNSLGGLAAARDYHVGSNDVIGIAQAKEIFHYIAQGGTGCARRPMRCDIRLASRPDRMHWCVAYFMQSRSYPRTPHI